MEREIFEKTLAELKEYAEKRGMLLSAEGASIKVVKDVTKEVEECMFDVVWEEMREAEKTCEKSCLILHAEHTKWQRECFDVCLKCWEMTKRGECASRAVNSQIEHIFVMESILKLRGLLYHGYWRVDIDDKVIFTAEFKPPSEV
jgi:16S rRNA C1402 (ribose-2'-O) methylase RsmI